MKKKNLLIIILLLIITTTSCKLRLNENNEKTSTGPSPNSTFMDLASIQFQGLKEKNAEKYLSVFPEFEREYLKNKYIDSVFETYDNVIDYELEEKEREQISQSEIDTYNKDIRKKFNSNSTISECFYVHGYTTIIAGQNQSKEKNAFHQLYCKIDGNWYFLL